MAPPPAVHIIDDDEAVRDSLAVLLEAHGLEVAAHDSALSFLDRFEDGSGGCVVTDVQMPEMNGLALLRALRDRAAAPPVIVVSGRADRAMAAEAMVLGAFAMIEKPFEPEAFLGVVHSALALAVGV